MSIDLKTVTQTTPTTQTKLFGAEGVNGTPQLYDPSFVPSGTGAVTRTVQTKLRDSISIYDFGGVGNGVADDSAAILSASVAAVAQNKDVDFGGGIWLIGTALALTSAHNGLRWHLRGATINKGFSGDLFTLTNTANFSIDGVGIIDGKHGTYTGRIFVLSGSSSTHPYFGAYLKFQNSTDSYIEFGADAGQYAIVDSTFIAATNPAQSDPRMIYVNGPDTGASQRAIRGNMNGYIQLDGAQAVHVHSPLITRVVLDANCNVNLISGVSWSNNGAAMTINGATTIITGCRFAGNVTLAAGSSGIFVGNKQTAGTFTDSSTTNAWVVYHTAPGGTYIAIGKHQLDVQATVAFQIPTRAAIFPGDANQTYTPGASGPDIIYATSLTTNRTVTLSTTGAQNGTVMTISRPGGDTGGPWTVAVGGTGTNLSTKQWCEVLYDGSVYRVLKYGTLP